MKLEDLKYGEFGFYKNFVEDPDDITSIFNARKSVLVDIDSLPLHHQIKAKRIIDGLTQAQLGKIVRLPASTICLIERGERLIPKNRYKEFESYLYEQLYSDGELQFTIDQDAPEEPIDMTIEE